MNNRNTIVTYLAPELPGLSSTFVYNEIIALERVGYRIYPVSIHKPECSALEMEEMADRTFYLYSEGLLKFIFDFIINIVKRPVDIYKSIQWLISDVISSGFYKINTLKLMYQYLAANSLARKIISNKSQHIHIHFAHVPAQVGMYASKISCITYSVTSHANDIFERGFLLNIKADRSLCFATISNFNVRYLQKCGVPVDKLKVIRCGIKVTQKIDYSCKKKKTFTIGSLGRLVEKKGMVYLITAIKILKDQNIIVMLEIAGDGPLKTVLENEVKKLGISNQVMFKGAIGHESVSKWLEGLDAFVLACVEDSNGDKDGIPVSLMEAMGQQIAVISTRISGIPELIKHNETGLLSEPGDATCLAEQIHRLISDTQLTEKLAKSGKEIIYSEFSEEVNIKRLQKCFNL